jgi:alanine racemase
MAVVKADAFGHGALDVARTALAHGARWLGVMSVDEALALRLGSVDGRVLSWLNPVGADFEAAVRARVELAVPDVRHLDAIARAAAATGAHARVHLHLDTGMARDGAEAAEWYRLCTRARAAEVAGLVDVVGVMGHLPCADDPLHRSNAAGRSTFVRGLRVAREAGLRIRVRHLAATAAALTDPRTHLDLVRAGAGIVGLEPTGGSLATGAGLVGAMTLTAPVVGVRRVPAGTGVGYGHQYVTPLPTWLGLLPLGYADGLPRSATGTESQAEVLVPGPLGERRARVVGVASMDQVVVDLGAEPVPLGTRATVFGPGRAGEPTLTDWARWAGTLPHEIASRIGPRVTRTVLPAPVPAVHARRG